AISRRAKRRQGPAARGVGCAWSVRARRASWRLLAQTLKEPFQYAAVVRTRAPQRVDAFERLDLSIVKDANPVREGLGGVQNLRRVDHRAPALRRGTRVALESDDAVWVHARSERLVEQPYFRVHGQQGDERRLVGLPARELIEERVFLARQIELA